MIDFKAESIKKLTSEQFQTIVIEKLSTTLHFFENSPEQIKAAENLSVRLKEKHSLLQVSLFVKNFQIGLC